MGVFGGIRRGAVATWRFISPTYWYGFRRLRPDDLDFLTEPAGSTQDTNPIAPPHAPLPRPDATESRELPPQLTRDIPEPRWTPTITPVTGTAVPCLSLRAGWTVCKDPELPDSNEDAAVWIPNRQAAAVFDGATESFAAKRWVSILRDGWKRAGALDLPSLQQQYADEITSMNLTWAQQQASERGSFTTLASVEPTDGGLAATCIGDSAIILIREATIVQAFPSRDPQYYSSVPDALGSHSTLLDSGQELLRLCSWTIPLDPGEIDCIALVTDAVAVWLLLDNSSSEPSRLTRTLAIDQSDDWEALVTAERAAGHMKVDDSTVLLLEVSAGP